MTKSLSSLRSIRRSVRKAASTYASALRTPGAIGFFTAAGVARLGVAMTGFGLLFSIHYATGSYAIAGGATGVFAAAEAVLGPQQARLVDRWGQTRIVPATVGVHASFIVVAIVVAAVAPVWVTLVSVGVAGATVPQPGALSAARWSNAIHDPGPLRAAFSLEAALNDVVYLAGPVVVAVTSTLFTWWAGSAIAATCLLTGCVALSIQTRTAPPARGPNRSGVHRADGQLWTRSFARLLGVNLGLGCFFGGVPVLVTAAATAGGLQPLAGAILALSSAASIVSGLAYGAWRVAPSPRRVQLIGSLLLLISMVIGALWPTLPGLITMLLIGGAAIAPILSSTSHLVQATTSRGRLTEGFTWVNTASAAGIATAAALTGTLVAADGIPTAAFALLGLVTISALSASTSRPDSHTETHRAATRGR